MKASFRAKYLPILALFAAKRDVRYYLEGFRIEPAPMAVGGVLLIATDGHTAVIIHDPQGGATEPAIVPIPKELLSKCKKDKTDKMLAIDRFVDVTESEMWITSGPGLKRRIGVAIDLIDGVYPNFSRILPDYSTLGPVDLMTVNPEYLARVQKGVRMLPGSKGYPSITFRAESNHHSLYCFHANADEDQILFIVMPMRGECKMATSEPDWLKQKRIMDNRCDQARHLFVFLRKLASGR